MKDPREYIDKENMSILQYIVVFITVTLNAIDGFDVLSISFAAPGIAQEWGITQAALGVVLSMELIGMVIGSYLLGGAADRFGRRPTLLWCLCFMTIGMFMVTTVTSVFQLCVWRVVVGLGIGGILACMTAVVAEFSNIKKRSMCISIMVIGYPLGGTLGGIIASNLLATHDWRSIFYLGTVFSCTLIPLVYFFVPESVHWLAQKQPPNALKKINTVLNRMKFPSVDQLPQAQPQEEKKSIAGIFSPHMLGITLILTTTYFFHITTFYFIMKWSPKVVADMGFAPSLAGQVLVWVSFSGVLGAALFGWLTTRIDVKKLSIITLLLTTIFVAVFGRTSADLGQIKLLAAAAGFFGSAGVSGLYSLLALAFPTDFRATGTGFVIGTGRAGAVLSPIMAGLLLHNGAGLSMVAFVMGLGSLLGAFALFFLKVRPQ